MRNQPQVWNVAKELFLGNIATDENEMKYAGVDEEAASSSYMKTKMKAVGPAQIMSSNNALQNIFDISDDIQQSGASLRVSVSLGSVKRILTPYSAIAGLGYIDDSASLTAANAAGGQV